MSSLTATLPSDMSTETASGAAVTSIGHTLKRSREERNLSLDEAARATKIRKEFLLAIEDDKLEQLPGPVFARGFVWSYAEYLSLDAGSLVTRMARTSEGREIPQMLGATPRAALVSWPVLTAGVGAAVALVAFLLSR